MTVLSFFAYVARGGRMSDAQTARMLRDLEYARGTSPGL